MTQPVIRASDIALFNYCERAWGYAARGLTSSHGTIMSEGSSRHRAHAALIKRIRLLQIVGVLLLLAGVVMVAVEFFGAGG
ncbi:MAG: hypothetical protein ACK2T2_01420 [Anaerolineales bacterium]